MNVQIALEVLLPPFVACLILTGIHTYLGLHVVSRGVIFVDLALAQIAALGATFAFLLGHDPHGNEGYLYSLLFAFIGAAIFSISRLKDQRVPQEAIIGITFAVASAAAILIADRAPQGAEFVEAMLTGALLWVPWPTIVKTAGIYALIGAFHWIFRERFLTISFDPDRAHREGLPIRWWDFLFYTSFGFVITSSVAMAGVLLVFSFLVIPSVISMLFASRIRTRLAIGWMVGTLVSSMGLALSYAYDFPSGPAVVCTFGLALVAAAVVRYVLVAENSGFALARVAVGAVVVTLGLWGAFRLGQVAPAEQRADAGPSEEAPTAPAETAAEALASLESVPEGESPPAELVEELLSVRQELHRLMATGQIDVTESAVNALSRSAAGGVSETLEEIAHHAVEPWARLRASEALLERHNEIGLEALIVLLDEEVPPFVHLKAAEALREATGEDFGFAPEADPEARARAVERWREWWRSHRGEPFFEP